MKLEIKHTIQGIEYHSPYDAGLVASLKSKIPQNERAWNSDSKCWIVHPKHKTLLDDLSMQFFGNYPDVIGIPKSANAVITKLLQVKYIGVPKDRGGGNNLSFALDFDGNWNIVFSEDVLRDWFENGISGQQAKMQYDTLYGVLAIARTCAGTDIKTAYRKAAKRFHPDVNHDDDAGEMFKKIQYAYEVLSDPLKRRKYDAGLMLETSMGNQPDRNHYNGNSYRPPFRCGVIMATGKEEIGRFVVEKILQWEPVKRGTMELVTSWDKDLQMIVEEWI